MKISLLEFWVIPGFFLAFFIPNLQITNYITILALAIILFDVSSRFKIKNHDHTQEKGIKLTLTTLGLSIIILTPILGIFFGIVVALFLASILAIDEKNGFIIALFALIISSVTTGTFESIFASLQSIILGLGTGLIIGIIFLKYMREYYHEHISPLILLTIILCSYLFANTLGGNGYLAILTLGFMFGNVYVKQKKELEEFSKSLSKVIEIAAFLTLGIVAPLSITIIAISLLAFALMIALRYASVKLVDHGNIFVEKSILFVALGLLFTEISGVVLIVLILNKGLSLLMKKY